MATPWPEKSLGEAGEWLSGGTPSKTQPELWSGSIPWVSPKDMKVPRIARAIDCVSEEALGNGTRLVPPNTILMVVRGMILAHTFPVALTTAPVAFNQDIKALRPTDDLDPEFVLYWLQSRSSEILRAVDIANHGTKRLPTERLFALPIALAPLGEQRKIAAILASVDETVEKTAAVIAQLQVVKKAMMQELLTRGLPGRHRHVKMCAFGEIPSDWELLPLSDMVQSQARPVDVDANTSYAEIGVRSHGKGLFYKEPVLGETLGNKRVFWVEPGCLVLNIVFAWEGAVAVTSEHEKGMIASHRFPMYRPDPVRLNLERSEFLKTPIPLPSLDEQEKIAGTMNSIEASLRQEQSYLASVRRLKEALMSALLTGEVRVTQDEDTP